MCKRTPILLVMAYFFLLATMNAVSCSPTSHVFVTGSQKSGHTDNLIFDYTEIIPARQEPETKTVSDKSDVPASPYIIKVRIVIEEDEEGNRARTPEQVAADLDVAEQFFRKIHMSFSIVDAEVVPFNLGGRPSMRDYRNDALMHSDTMSIYYIFGHKWLTPTGLSSFPWNRDQFGIFMSGKYADEFTLAHEIGHYFGLYHTFDEADKTGDYVRDTVDESEWDVDSGIYATYDNLMNYTSAPKRHLTMGQLERVRYYLTTYRLDHLLIRSADLGTIEISVDKTEEPAGVFLPVPFSQGD